MKKIKLRSEFEKWVETNYYFEDARMLHLEPIPGINNNELPSNIVMELAYQIEGNYKAYSVRKSRVFRLIFSSIAEYKLLGDEPYNPEHWSECMEIIESNLPIAFLIDVPGRLTLTCNEVNIEELPLLIEKVQPWLSNREIYAEINSMLMPTPEDWIQLFANYNHTVVWHYYKGEPVHVSNVPISNYVGWFLQEPNTLDFDHQGIFFFTCAPNNLGFNLHIENHNASGSLWASVQKVIGNFKNAKINCGNCEFDNQQWLDYIENGNLNT